MKICIFTAICEEDKVWATQYIKEMERLQLPFVIYLDRCSQETKDIFAHPLCVGKVEQNNPDIEFNERAKQAIFDIIPKDFEWACGLDIDEVFEKDTKFDMPDADYVSCNWVNLWGDEKHIRVDGHFLPKPRWKFYRLGENKWAFLDKTTNGAYLLNKESVSGHVDVMCVHYGLMTKELRQMHKERWDRIYTKASGRNPYGFWDYALDESIEPLITNNPYL